MHQQEHATVAKIYKKKKKNAVRDSQHLSPLRKNISGAVADDSSVPDDRKEILP